MLDIDLLRLAIFLGHIEGHQSIDAHVASHVTPCCSGIYPDCRNRREAQILQCQCGAAAVDWRLLQMSAQQHL